MITDKDRQDLGDLAMRALDTILDEYGEEAKLRAAVLVFEVEAPDDDGDSAFHGHYKSLHRNTPHHIGGLCWATGQWLLTP